MTSSSVSSRREPWPYHLKLGIGNSGHGLMLVPQATGLLVGRKTQTLEDVTPTAQEYDSAPVYKERTFPFRPTRGLGEHVQSSHTSRRYRFAINVQCVNGLFGKGPYCHTITPATTGAIRDFVEGLHSGSVAQFILAGQNVLRRTDDTDAGQVVSDSRGGRTATSAVRFKGAYASPVDGLYVAWDDGAIKQYNGSSWATATLPAGFTPSFLEVVGDELWAGGGNQIRKVTGDPMLSASWSGSIVFTAGDASANVTALRQVENRLFIFKDDGSVLTLNADGSDNDLFPGLRATRDSTNARTVAAGLDSLWFRVGQSFYRLSALGGASLTPAGPERLRDNDSRVNGPVQAFVFWGEVVGFAATYYGTNSYLWTYGSWQVPTEGDAQAHFADQWDGALVEWLNRQVTAMKVSSIAGSDRLYVGFADGTIDWIKLTLNPFAAGSGAEFTLNPSEMYVPIHHGMFQADWKAYPGFSVFGPVLNSRDWARIRFRTDSGKPYAALVQPFTTPGQRVETSNAVQPTSTAGTIAQFIGATIGSLLGSTIGSLKTRLTTDLQQSTIGKYVDVKIELVNSSSADTPVLEGIGIHEQVRPQLKLDFSGTIDARSHVAKLDGGTDRKSAESIHDLVLQAAGAPAAVTLTMPDETVQGLTFFHYQERLLPPRQRAGLGWHIDFEASQFNTLTVYGTINRLKGSLIGDLKGIAIGQLRTM